MVYAQIIVKQRTNVEELTYAVPPEIVPYIRSGSLVSVPLRRKIVQGTVVGLKATVPLALKGKIRPIASIERASQLSEVQVAVMRLLADYYAASLAEVAFHALGPTPINLEDVPVEQAPKPIFVQGDFEARIERYTELIAGKMSKNFVCIFAQASFAQHFVSSLQAQFAEVIYDDGSAKARKRIQGLRAGSKRLIVVGTLHKIFSALRAGDYLVVDQPGHIGLKSQQRPFMRAKTIGVFRSRVEKIQLVLGDLIPEVTDLPFFLRHDWLLERRAVTNKPILVISRQGSSDIIASSLLELLAEKVAASRSVLLVVLARGWASALVCRDCSYTFECQNCGRTLAVEKEGLACRYCSAKYPTPTTCPKCRGDRLHPVGEGVARVATEIVSHLPNIQVQQISSDAEYDANAPVTVATERITSFPRARFDTVLLLSVDRLLTGVGLRDNWDLLALILHLQSIAGELVAQTYFPESKLWGFAGTGRVREFFAQELARRKKLALPPYATLFAVVGQASSLAKLQEEANHVTELLTKALPNCSVGRLEADREPSGKYSGRLFVLTARLKSAQKSEIRSGIMQSWHLDIEPV